MVSSSSKCLLFSKQFQVVPVVEFDQPDVNIDSSAEWKQYNSHYYTETVEYHPLAIKPNERKQILSTKVYQTEDDAVVLCVYFQQELFINWILRWFNPLH